MLNPGAHAVVVADEAAFLNRYSDPASPWYHADIRIAGAFSGGLKNSTETLVVTSADGNDDIATFAYEDGGAWPGRADGPREFDRVETR